MKVRSIPWFFILAIAGAATAFPQIVFIDATSGAGISFQHSHGGCGRRDFVEQVGGGAAFFDFDGDAWLDLFLLSGARLPNCPEGAGDGKIGKCGLFRNLKNGRFEEVLGAAGMAAPGYATGCAAGDFDNDGDVDLYVACHGPNRLYRNDGGVFVEIGERAGVADPGLSASASFLDFDGDGDLDLYVSNYVILSGGEEPRCRKRGVPAYCLPQDFPAAPDRLYQNQGNGRFVEVSRQARTVPPVGRGLGVAVGDYDNDGRPDLYVANDANDNFLFHNQGDGTFSERALLAGVAVSEDGEMENGMGTDWGDFDNDTRLDLIVTNFEGQANTLYRNLGNGFFQDVSYASGTGGPSFPFLGWAAIFADFDLDGWMDLFIANGHVFDNVAEFQEGSAFAQPNLLFHNEGGGKFTRVEASASPALSIVKPSRGAAAGDFDNDGDLDLAVNNWNGAADLLRNDTPRRGRHWLGIECIGRKANRSAIGARVTVRAGGFTQVREVKSGSGYLSQSDLRLLFGLGSSARIDALTVRWPGGAAESFPVNVPVDAYLRLVEGTGQN